MKISTLIEKSNEYLSPMYVFGEPIEFDGYKFKSPYLFLQSLKIPPEQRTELLEFYLDEKNLKKLYTIKNEKISYTSQFNQKSITSIILKDEEIDIDSVKINIYIKNMYTALSAQNDLFKYTYSLNKYQDLEFEDFEFSNIKYIDSKRLNTILR